MQQSKFNLVLALVCLLPLCISADFCIPSSQFALKSQNKRLEVAGSGISIKGLNWWGTETGILSVGGLQTQSMDFFLDKIAALGFNGLRIPFTLDMALNPTKRYPNSINTYLNPDLANLPAVEVMDRLFQKAAARGIVILLDQHRFDVQQFDSSPVWFTWADTPNCITNMDGVCKVYYIEDDQAGWNYMVGKFKKYWNFIGIDLLNEPHSWARWGNDNTNDWAQGAAIISNYVIAQHPDWHGLFFVEGVEQNPNCQILGCFDGCANDGHWWGGNMEGLRCADVKLTDMSRLVYSPHVYGVSVFDQAYFSAPDFPNNLPYIYDTHFGFAMELTGRAVVIGEWGGPLTGRDSTIQETQASYFKSHGIDSSFYWALNPNPGGDTDGLFEPDWTTVNPTKADFLARAHPNPTKFTVSGTQICVSSTSTAPSTPAPSTPAPSTPAPSTPAPSTPAPSTPAPSTPAPVATNIKAQLASGSGQYWLGVTFTNDGGATSKVQLRDATTYKSWVDLTSNNWGATTWTLQASGPLGLPIDLQITSTSGKVVTAIGVIPTFDIGVPRDMGASYTGSAAPSTTAPSTPAPSTPAPSTPAPSTPAPSTPAPSTPAPSTPVPSTPAPSTPAPSGPTLKFQGNSGNSQWWFAVSISGETNGAVASVALIDSGAVKTYSPLALQTWGAWVYSPSAPLVAPITVRATSSSGKQVTAVFSTLGAGTTVDSGSNF